MTCPHEIYSRYLGSETDADGVEWCIVGCRECDATIRFPADARLARLREAAAAMPPDFDPHEKIEDLGAHFAECHKLKMPSP